MRAPDVWGFCGIIEHFLTRCAALPPRSAQLLCATRALAALRHGETIKLIFISFFLANPILSDELCLEKM
jgi:hypothetical protein